MSKLVEIYDPPMCCSTGVCGPSVDPQLVAIQGAIGQLLADGITVKRYQITMHPGAFMKNPEIAALMQTPSGVKTLPVTVVNGVVIKKQAYPTIAEIMAVL